MRTKIVLTLDNEPNPDPANGPFYTVTYGAPPVPPEIKAARRRRARQNELYMSEINSNPLTKYLYERDQEQEFAARRLAKQPGWDTKSWEQVLRHVKANWNNSAEPTILGSRAHSMEEGYSNRMTLRQHLKASRRINEPARLNAVERAAEDGNYQVRNFDSIFIDQVKQLRNDKGLSQKDLAVAINRPASEIAALERGELPFNGELKSLLHQKLGF
jgi:hypothetical protein